VGLEVRLDQAEREKCRRTEKHPSLEEVGLRVSRSSGVIVLVGQDEGDRAACRGGKKRRINRPRERGQT
jgi:1,4-dihydroxy-2-naphthoyl-CoA synthase